MTLNEEAQRRGLAYIETIELDKPSTATVFDGDHRMGAGDVLVTVTSGRLEHPHDLLRRALAEGRAVRAERLLREARDLINDMSECRPVGASDLLRRIDAATAEPEEGP